MTTSKRREQFWQHVNQHQLSMGEYQLAYASIIPSNAKAAITLVNGRCESYLKYQELIFDLTQMGYAVFTFDHLGQGLSSRLLSEPEKGYIDTFSQYTDSLAYFVEHIVQPQWQGKHYLLAHSMGAAISYLYLAKHQHIFEKCIFSAPMFGIPTAGIPRLLARAIAKSCVLFGLGKQYFISQGSFENKAFEINQLMHDKVRYQAFQTLYTSQPNLRLGGVTCNWLAEALKATVEIESTQITIPGRVLQAEKESIVLNRAQNKVVAHNETLEMVVFANSFHEILFETDAIRNAALKEIEVFFNAQYE